MPEPKLVVSEDILNASKEYTIYQSGWIEIDYAPMGQLYRNSRSWHGRCAGHVYIDNVNHGAIPVGWVFLCRKEYSNLHPHKRFDRYYIQEVWRQVGLKIGHLVYAVNVKTGKALIPSDNGGYSWVSVEEILDQ